MTKEEYVRLQIEEAKKPYCIDRRYKYVAACRCCNTNYSSESMAVHTMVPHYHHIKPGWKVSVFSVTGDRKRIVRVDKLEYSTDHGVTIISEGREYASRDYRFGVIEG